MTIGPSHNYYSGRPKSDITQWVDHFWRGVADSFEKVRKRAHEAADAGAGDESARLRKLDPRQRKALALFRRGDAITSHDVETLFAISQRSARNLLSAWVRSGFVTILDPARKSRKYDLERAFKKQTP